MARNRKRAKERRARRPQPVGRPAREQLTGAPSPLEHAAPDAEIAEQAELPPDGELELSPEDEAEFEEEAEESAEEEEEAEARGDRGGRGFDGGDGGGGGELAVPGGTGPIAERRPRTGSRLLTFLQGSWAELQRVQWPDRRQVMQATGVVIGFVIVAGVFLGVADWAAKHLVNYILQGHF
jgi:preprotein translocase subunit SecE